MYPVRLPEQAVCAGRGNSTPMARRLVQYPSLQLVATTDHHTAARGKHNEYRRSIYEVGGDIDLSVGKKIERGQLVQK